MFKTIMIVGGGLAGLTLGIGLRREGVPVVIWEMGQYPRHRVCGEFISGHGQETLRRLGLLELLLEAGAQTLMTARFFSSRRSFPAHPLPQPALCLSRFKLDALLAEQFQKLGGELRCGTRWPRADFADEGVVRANGRRVQAESGGWHWFGVKAHVWNLAPLTADLELHLCPNGYVGMSRLSDGKANVCGLFRRKKGEADSAHGIAQRLRGQADSILAERLAAAEFDGDSLCAVGGLMLNPRRAESSSECCIGDSLTMIAPVTGNGMSMAFESAELAVAPLVEYAAGRCGWATARQTVAERCNAAFDRRLGWATRLQQLLMHPHAQKLLLPLFFRSQACWRLLFWATR